MMHQKQENIIVYVFPSPKWGSRLNTSYPCNTVLTLIMLFAANVTCLIGSCDFRCGLGNICPVFFLYFLISHILQSFDLVVLFQECVF